MSCTIGKSLGVLDLYNCKYKCDYKYIIATNTIASTWKEACGGEGGPAREEGLQQGHAPGGHIHSPTQPGRAASYEQAVGEGSTQHRQGPPCQVAHRVGTAVPPQLRYLHAESSIV